MSLIAVTGGTGFVGRHLLNAALAAGHRLRALARSPQMAREGIDWIAGSLEDSAALAALVAGAQAVIHVAGAINAPDRAGFDRVNVAGTAAVVAAANAAGIPRFVHVSSLSAREPALSDYGGSKAASEAVVMEAGAGWRIVRPPAVYGPGDRETLQLFRMAARGVVLLPPAGRLSLIHVDDLASLLLRLADDDTMIGLVVEPDDGRIGGWSHGAFAEALGEAVGRPVRALPLPAWAVRAGALLDGIRGRATGVAPRLSRDRARYMCHPDWAVAEARRPSPGLWAPAIATPEGLAETAAWYRSAGWLRR